MNNTPPPDGWPLLVVAFILFVLADRMLGRRFWEFVKWAGIVVLIVVLVIGASQ